MAICCGESSCRFANRDALCVNPMDMLHHIGGTAHRRKPSCMDTSMMSPTHANDASCSASGTSAEASAAAVMAAGPCSSAGCTVTLGAALLPIAL